MDIKHIDADFSVSPQIAVTDMNAIKAAGFRAIICNRPDKEDEDQPSISQIEVAAKEAGLSVAYLPVRGGEITEQDVAQFGQLLNDLPQPILGYCRSGARSQMLWAQYQQACVSHS